MVNREDNDRYYDLQHLSSEYADLGVSTLREHIKGGGLPSYKVGGKILVKKSEFDEWIERFRVDSDKTLNTIVNSVMDSLN